ncbi:MAG TPA: DUF3311 domain-containing protein [Candidatus Angelobacter sp.]
MPVALAHEDENPGSVVRVKRPSLGAVLLGLIPFVGICFLVPFWDRIYPMVLGLPFNMFWLVLWIVISPLCMWGAYRLERPGSGDGSSAP